MIRFAIVGCGHWGPNYIRILRWLEGVEIAAACDREEKSLQRIRKQ